MSFLEQEEYLAKMAANKPTVEGMLSELQGIRATMEKRIASLEVAGL